jgi:hypothetical protein
MSGATPAAPSLECPECSWDVLPSETGLWPEDREPEHCPGCGALVGVVVDDGDPDRVEARAVLIERGGEVVARLRAELAAEVARKADEKRTRALPANRLLVEFTLPDDTSDAADEVFAFLDSAEQLGATPDGLGWRDADIGELRIWAEGLEPVPEGVTSLRSTFKVRDDLGRELPTAGVAWGSGFDLHESPFTVRDSARTHKIEDMIVSKAPLDAAKTYLVIVVEHPDEAIRG